MKVVLACLALAVGIPARAETPVDVDAFLIQKLASWQTRLQLEDWKIGITQVHKADLKKRTLGGIRWDKDSKTAHIEVLHPADYTVPFGKMLQDLERTIVHELVHLELSGLPRRESTRATEESAVNRIAEALLGPSRE